MAGAENETQSICYEIRKGLLGAPDAGTLRRIYFGGTLKSARQGRIVGADRRQLQPIALPTQWRSIEPQKRRSANGSQAGTTEHSGFLPQHSAKGTAQYYDLSGQRREADGPYPVVRQILGGARNQQPGAAHLQARDFDRRHLARGPQSHGPEAGGGVRWGGGERDFRFRFRGIE